jgi:tetratricopeptide (TPR) repeat protein
LLRHRALFAAQNGDFEFALAAFNHLIQDHPKSAPDYNNRGLVHFQSGQFAQALADYNQSIQLDPSLANAYNNRANYYAALGDLELALEDYDQALQLEPTNVRAWVNQGITFREMNLYEPAIENFTHALELNQHTNDPLGRLLLESHIFAERGRTHHLGGDWNCAITEYQAALDRLNSYHQLSTETAGTLGVNRSHTYLEQQLEEWVHELNQPLRG